MIYIILYIVFIHWVADFVAQTDEMARGKSTSIKWLTRHVVAYGNVFGAGALPFLIYYIIKGENHGILIVSYILLNMGLHWITDYFTSKQTSKLWAKGEVHNFFVVVGFDQFIHMACLILTYQWLIA